MLDGRPGCRPDVITARWSRTMHKLSRPVIAMFFDGYRNARVHVTLRLVFAV